MLKESEEFRKYTYSKKAETAGRYSKCRACEAINQRFAVLKKRFASGVEMVSTTEAQELSRIKDLFALLDSRGLRVPAYSDEARTLPLIPENKSTNAIDKLYGFYAELPETIKTRPVSTVELPEGLDIPDELKCWLDADMRTWVDNELSPEYLQETVYESLKAKYRPSIGVDSERLIPVYDDTYKQVLNEILRKFDDYEEYVTNFVNSEKDVTGC